MMGVSMDPIYKQRLFSDKFGLPFDLLSDETGQVCDSFGVAHPGGKPRRETFLFRRGQLVWHDRSASTKGQARDLLKAMARYHQE